MEIWQRLEKRSPYTLTFFAKRFLLLSSSDPFCPFAPCFWHLHARKYIPSRACVFYVWASLFEPEQHRNFVCYYPEGLAYVATKGPDWPSYALNSNIMSPGNWPDFYQLDRGLIFQIHRNTQNNKLFLRNNITPSITILNHISLDLPE